jgi:hypothetical protein
MKREENVKECGEMRNALKARAGKQNAMVARSVGK